MLHIHPTAPLAERVLLPGDPGRALRLATALMQAPKMFNHNRGLWGYTGTAHDGELLTIQSTGMGGPSAAIVIHELLALGARTLLRVGTCGAVADGVALGELVIATEALAADGTSRALGAGERAPASASLLESVVTAAGQEAALRVRTGPIVTSDLFYDERSPELGWRRQGAIAVEMECSVLFTLARRNVVDAAAVLAVTDTVMPPRTRIEAEPLELAELAMGRIALSALGIHGHVSTSG